MRNQKKWSGVVLRLFVGVCLWIAIIGSIGCGSKSIGSKSNGSRVKNASFNATVLEVDDYALLVRPFDGEGILRSADRISIGRSQISKDCMAKIKVGTNIRVLYDGDIQETYPAGIAHILSLIHSTDPTRTY